MMKNGEMDHFMMDVMMKNGEMDHSKMDHSMMKNGKWIIQNDEHGRNDGYGRHV